MNNFEKSENKNEETMSKYIDANDFLDLFYLAALGQDKAFIKTVEMVVSETPTLNIVQCKDCKYWWSPMQDDAHYCRCKYGLNGVVAEEDFCSFGKRRDNDEDN